MKTQAGYLRFVPMLHLAIAQLRPQKGAYRDNLDQVEGVFREVAGWDPTPDLVLFPESALTQTLDQPIFSASVE